MAKKKAKRRQRRPVREPNAKRSAKSDTPKLIEIPAPTPAKPVRADQVVPGPTLPPITRVRTFSANEWEDFVQEWAQSLKSRYRNVMRCSGAGDMGRDVVAHAGDLSSEEPWDNYQCKHYDHPLRPSDIWIELGKLVYYTFKREFTVPRKYYFVCPRDVGTSLARILENPVRLREQLLANWGKYCQMDIVSEEVPLSGDLRKHVEEFPFDIVTQVPVLKVIEEHRNTPWYIHRFGGGLPPRPEADSPPDEYETHEIPYVSELFRAYSDHQGKPVNDVTLSRWPRLQKHFQLSRASFYSAESLQEFSRDHLPEDEYSRLKNEIQDGVQETYLQSHTDGFEKVRAVAKSAIDMQITDHPLLPVLQPPDRRGICHQLVNDGEFVWIDNDGKDD